MIYNNVINNNLETAYVQEQFEHCDNLEDLKRHIFEAIVKQQDLWKMEINKIIVENNFTQMQLAKLCGLSRVSVNKWCNGAIPKKRETFLKIGMAANFSLEQMNHFLKRYGRYPELYSKSLEDCVCIFVINQKYGKEAFEKYQYILSSIKKFLEQDNNTQQENMSTVKFDSKLKQVKTEKEFEKFISDNVDIFNKAFNKLYVSILSYFDENKEKCTINELADGQGWSSSMRHTMYEINNYKWYPTRLKIISIGLHLGYNIDGINELLKLAHMEPLYVKNIFESVIIYTVNDLELNGKLDKKQENYNLDELFLYTKEVLEKLNIDEINDFINELDPDK